jgi:hypothetical protein
MPALRTSSTSCLRFASAVACLVLTALPATACKVKAIFVQPSGEVPEKAVLVVAGKFEEIELPQRNLSEAVELPSGDLAVAVLPGRPAQAELPAAAPKFKIPAAWTNCVLLFFHDPSNQVFPARVIPVNTSSADFPIGHTMVFNVTPATVVAKFGTAVIRIKPGQSESVKPSGGGDEDYSIAIDCAYPGDQEPTVVCRSVWPHEKKVRQILFITPVPDQKVPRVWGVLDHPEPGGKKDKGS